MGGISSYLTWFWHGQSNGQSCPCGVIVQYLVDILAYCFLKLIQWHPRAREFQKCKIWSSPRSYFQTYFSLLLKLLTHYALQEITHEKITYFAKKGRHFLSSIYWPSQMQNCRCFVQKKSQKKSDGVMALKAKEKK